METASPMVNTKPILVEEAKEIDQRIEGLNLVSTRICNGPRILSMLISVLISNLTDGIEAREGQPLYISKPNSNTVPYKCESHKALSRALQVLMSCRRWVAIIYNSLEFHFWRPTARAKRSGC